MSSSGPTRTLYNFLKEEHQRNTTSLVTFLCCSRRLESPASILRDQTDVQKLIGAFTTETPNEDSCYYKVKIDMCTGTEHVHVEALHLQGGWWNLKNQPPGTTFDDVETGEFAGSLNNMTMSGAGSFLGFEKNFIRAFAYMRNQDGSFVTEGQLRTEFREYMSEALCQGRRCRGKCIALPGDTVYWKFDPPYRVVTRWEPAPDEELRERGFLHQGGFFYRNLELYREDPSQLSSSDDDSE